jgi:hypothetical protein
MTERAFTFTDEVPSMKRLMCGMVLLAAGGFLGCNGDPTESFRGGEELLADPSSVFVDEGGSEFVTVELVDGQGNQLATTFTAQDVQGGITVEEDTTFLATTTGTHLPTQARFVVTGVSRSVGSFVVNAGGASTTVPVRVLPTDFAPTFSNAAPAQNEVVTLTAPEGFTFASDATITFGADEAVVTSVAEDGSSISFVPRPLLGPGGPITPTVTGALSNLFSSVPLTIPTVDAITLPLATAIAGTDDPNTAPTIQAPGVGQTAAFFDLPDFAATIDHFYKINVTEPGDYTVTVDWTIGSDVDAPICVADPTCAAEDFSDPTVTGNKPESGTFTLPAGVSTLWIEDFGAIAGQFPPFVPGTPAIGALLSIKIVRL